jgi:hypothetical protein
VREEEEKELFSTFVPSISVGMGPLCAALLLLLLSSSSTVESVFDPNIPPSIPSYPNGTCGGGSYLVGCFLQSSCSQSSLSFTDRIFENVGLTTADACTDLSSPGIAFTNVIFASPFYVIAKRTLALSLFTFNNCSGTVNIVILNRNTSYSLSNTDPSSIISMGAFSLTGGSALAINVYAGSGNSLNIPYPHEKFFCTSSCSSSVTGIKISSLSVTSNSALTLNAVNLIDMIFPLSNAEGILMNASYADTTSYLATSYSFYQYGLVQSVFSIGAHWLWSPQPSTVNNFPSTSFDVTCTITSSYEKPRFFSYFFT